MFLSDLLLYRLETEISQLCNQLDTDMFLRQSERPQLLARIKILVEQKEKVRNAINASQPSNQGTDH
jgi:hypothetical protein